MAEEQAQTTPLIDPEKVKSVLSPITVGVGSASQPEKKEQKKLAQGEYFWGLGRRKSSVARVRIRPGEGKVIVNKKELQNFFVQLKDQNSVLAPLVATDNAKKYDVFIRVNGGGMTGQAGAAMMGLARALCEAEQDCYQKLKGHGCLTRDSRMKERKKYGQRGARRGFQFSKR